MEWLNYHHLLYFWTTARLGSVTAAARELRLAQPTLSGQIRRLEETMGARLFARSGRRLVLTETGQIVFRYANEIFNLGREMMDTVKDRPIGAPIRFTVGVTDVLPKLVVHRLLEPVLELRETIRMVCVEDKPERLLADLAVHKLDLVLTDSPLGPMVKIRAFNHLLGECGTSFFATDDLAAKHKGSFPKLLDRAPCLLPTAGTALRRSLDQWFDARDIRPSVVSEFEDSALLKAFGRSGLGFFPGPTAIEKEIRRQFGVRAVGRVKEVREQFYAISVERRIKHPAVVAISEAARAKLFH